MPGKKDANDLLRVIEHLHAIKDLDIMLENILHEARTFVNSDAGTLYLQKDNKLYFAHIENDSLFDESHQSSKHHYMNSSIDVNPNSIAGFVAHSGQSLLIDDVYQLPPTVSFRFNPEFDKQTSYRTKSILAVPLKSSEGKNLGVIQLINAKNENNESVPFSQQDRLFISYFAQHASMALEKAEQAKEMVLRIVEITQLRDPHEGRLHARRVGEYSLELFDVYARSKGFPLAERNRKKEAFRLAAMLHDVGKVGISSTLLQKSEEYTEEDKHSMYWHVIYGARLFAKRESLWDKIAYEVVLNHHERWDGNGYPGHVEDIFSDDINFGKGKMEKEIPLSGRIVAIADVFDSLISTRSYKEAWDFDSALRYIKSKSGKQFDPVLVDLFLSIRTTLESIVKNFK